MAAFSLSPAMSLASSDISRIANLARLELDGPGSERMLSQLNDFFDIVTKMRSVDTTGVVPLAHPFETIGDIALRLREDVVSEPDNRAANQRSAPSVEAGLFLVPKVIE
jgi:aspartyl-tRNA(Asn)/glutamyl-tRNA(Gln) amidotransferase subunit C